MSQQVKFQLVPQGRLGPIMLIYPKLDDLTGTLSTTAMAYHQGTLYANTPPDQWQPIDHDRAAALGYGPSEPWPDFPAPDFIKSGPVTQYLNPKVDSMIRLDPAQQLQALEAARRSKLTLLNLTIAPHIAHLNWGGVRVWNATSDRTTWFPDYEFDALTVGQLAYQIKTRLK